MQAFESVTITIYVVADNPVANDEAWAGAVDQTEVYGNDPPAAVTVAVPLVPPLQLGAVKDMVIDIKVGWKRETLFVLVQLFESVTVTV